MQALPTSEKTLLTFTAYLYKKGLSASAVNVYLSAIRNLNIVNGHKVSDYRSPRIKLAVKSILSKGQAPVQKMPLTFEKLQVMWPVIQKCSQPNLWYAILSLAFYAGLRCAEYTPSAECPSGPSIQQVQFSHDGSILCYKVSRSKTQLHGFECEMACSGHQICAKCNMVTYLGDRMSKGKVKQSDSLFVYKSVTVSAKLVNRFIKQVAKSLGWDPTKFSAHSIRAGAATSAALAGFKDWELKSMGGWSSDTYMSYIRNTKNHTAKFPRRISRANSN